MEQHGYEFWRTLKLGDTVPQEPKTSSIAVLVAAVI